jgi:hypothetical protein
MAFDEALAERIRQALGSTKRHAEKKMFGENRLLAQRIL